MDLVEINKKKTTWIFSLQFQLCLTDLLGAVDVDVVETEFVAGVDERLRQVRFPSAVLHG